MDCCCISLVVNLIKCCCCCGVQEETTYIQLKQSQTVPPSSIGIMVNPKSSDITGLHHFFPHGKIITKTYPQPTNN